MSQAIISGQLHYISVSLEDLPTRHNAARLNLESWIRPHASPTEQPHQDRDTMHERSNFPVKLEGISHFQVNRYASRISGFSEPCGSSFAISSGVYASDKSASGHLCVTSGPLVPHDHYYSSQIYRPNEIRPAYPESNEDVSTYDDMTKLDFSDSLSATCESAGSCATSPFKSTSWTDLSDNSWAQDSNSDDIGTHPWDFSYRQSDFVCHTFRPSQLDAPADQSNSFQNLHQDIDMKNYYGPDSWATNAESTLDPMSSIATSSPLSHLYCNNDPYEQYSIY